MLSVSAGPATAVLGWVKDGPELDVYTVIKGQDMKPAYTIGTSSEADCAIARLYTYASADGGAPTGDTALDGLKLSSATTNQKTHQYFFAVGTKDGDKSPVRSASIIICGKETLAPTAAGAEVVKVGAADGDTKVITDAQVRAYFTLGVAAAGASDQCGIDKWELLDKDKKAATAVPAITKVAAGVSIAVTDAGLTAGGVTVFLRATTKGGVVVDKELKVAYDCVYGIETTKTGDLIVPYTAGAKVDPFAPVESAYKF